MAEIPSEKTIAHMLLNAAGLDELNPYAVEARYGTIEPDGLDRHHVLTVVTAVVRWAQSQVDPC